MVNNTVNEFNTRSLLNIDELLQDDILFVGYCGNVFNNLRLEV